MVGSPPLLTHGRIRVNLGLRRGSIMKATLVLLVAASLLVSASNGAGDPASRCLATTLP
jgi:hypothetical protein